MEPVIANGEDREGRRRVLKAGLGAASLFLPVPYALVWAQTEGTLKLLRLPKLALVIGNAKYEDVRPLTNSVNDARAIAESLKAAGFEVTTGIDLKREEMLARVRSHAALLEKRQCVGLFYFAGHGAQLAWRNYLLPVDTVINRVEDIPRQCVDLEVLIDGVRRASNPMNVIILDACRDNPFGRDFRVSEKGLSQMDAPNSTLLAYATSPGNYASDGEGVNGLYTENLLRELKVPEAKIEDVFKRVRLHVRRQSKGQQIPWESTSLEEDFYFVPPRTLAAQAQEEAERERKRDAELAEKRRLEEAAEHRRREEQLQREAKLAAEEAERRRRQELALLEKRRLEEEAERKRKNELALKEAQRAAEAAERRRREEQALREARLADEEAERRFKQELALQEKRRAEEEAERRRRAEQAQRELRQAEEAAARKREQEQALRDRQRAQEEADRLRQQGTVQIRKPSESEINRQFEEELAIWEKIRTSKQPGPLEDYLLRYPSGRFSELAQLRLDLVLAQAGEKKIRIVSDEKNPYTKGTGIATSFRVGDNYGYRVIDPLTNLEGKRGERVAQIGEDEIVLGNGAILDLLGNPIREKGGRTSTSQQTFVPEYVVGKRWVSRAKVRQNNGETYVLETEYRVTAREKISVPAGSFDAFRVEGKGWVYEGRSPGQTNERYWMAPDRVRRPVASEYYRRIGRSVQQNRRDELVSFRQT